MPAAAWITGSGKGNRTRDTRGVDRAAPRLAGLVLIASAVAKLVLFDLVALDGLARVAAFVGAGLLMLAAGTRYARLVARSQQ